MMNRFLPLIVCCLLVDSCGAAGSGGTGPYYETPATPSGGFAEDPIVVANVSETVFDQQRRFQAFSFTAQRVTAIDLDTGAEAWGKFVDRSFDYSFGLPGVDGIGLIGDNEFRIVSETGHREFFLGYESHKHWRSAKDTLALAFSSSNGTDLRILKNSDGSGWVELKLEPPESLVEDNYFPSPLITDDGSLVVYIYTKLGSYFTYRHDATEGYELETTCKFSATSDEIESQFDIESLSLDSAVLSSSDGALFLSAGKYIARVDVSADAGCQDFDDWQVTELSSMTSINRMILLESGQLAAVGANNGAIEVFDIEATALSSVKVFEERCSYPSSLSELSDEYLLLSCLRFYENSQTQPEYVDFHVIDRSADSDLREIEIRVDRLAKVGFNSDELSFIEFLDGGLGEIKITDLVAGTFESKVGLFIENILEKL